MKPIPSKVVQAILGRLTARQQRMFQVLKDGQSHTREELFACLDDDLAKLSAIQNPISDMRPIVIEYGYAIACCYTAKGVRYQLFQLVAACA